MNRETVRKLLREAGMAPKRSRRDPKHRKRRERMAQDGGDSGMGVPTPGLTQTFHLTV